MHLITLPLFHSFGSTVQMNAGFAVGATLVLLPRFDAAKAVALLQKEKITFFAGVPTMYWGLLGALTDDVDVDQIAANLRIAVSGGASLPVEIIRQFKDRFHVQILEGYGLSETSPLATFATRSCDPRPGSIGVPIWGVECSSSTRTGTSSRARTRIGEIAIRGHNVMKGYYNRPEATAEVMRDGWFRTGDLARRDEDGFYYIVDRAKDMIIRGGFNVYPREIEEVLMTPPGGLAGSRRRRPPRLARRGGQGVRHPRARGRGDRERAAVLGQGADGRLQVPAHRRVRQHACR